MGSVALRFVRSAFRGIASVTPLILSAAVLIPLLHPALLAAADTNAAFQVTASANDVNEVNGTLDASSSTVWLGAAASATNSYAGFRFTNVTVPPGATITSAYVMVYSVQSQWITMAFALSAEASGNSAAFSTTSRPSQRALTVNSVSRSDNVSWAANTWYALNEMKGVVQEVVNRSDWQAGNSLSVILRSTGAAYARKYVRSFEGAAATAPILVVNYSTAGASQPSATFNVSPTAITAGQSATLSWTSTNATSVTIDQGIGAVALSGSVTVSPTTTTTYTLTASNGTSSTTQTATLTVNAAPVLPTGTLSIAPTSIQSGSTATLSWSTNGATSVSIDQGIGAVAATGSLSLAPSATTTYTLTATNAAGSILRTATVTVTASAGTLTRQISTGGDNVNEVNGTLSTNTSTVWLGNGGSTTTSYAGFRFTNVGIPIGATITSATLQVYSTQAQWIGYSFTIAADAAGNSAAFSTTSRPSQRVLTANAITHNDDVNWAASSWYTLDEMKAVVQEIVGRSDWQAGNSVSFILKGMGTGAYARKFVNGFDGGAANAARLVVTYNGGGTTTPTPTVTFSVTPTTIAPGAPATLSWSSTNATSVSIDQGIGNVATSGSRSVSPTATTTYRITATGAGGSATQTATLTVSPVPTVTFSVSPTTIAPGGPATLSWSTTNATSVSIDQGIGTVAASGTRSVSPTATTTYRITATGPGGSATQTATLTVSAVPTVTFSVTPGSITAGASATLSWSTTNATNVSIDQGIGTVAASGTRAVSPTVTTTYTITATGTSGTASQTATLAVSPVQGTPTYFALPGGFVDVVPHQIVRTALDRLYVVAALQPYSPTLRVYWTTAPGLPMSGADFNGSAQISPGSSPISVSPAYDGNSTIHIVVNYLNGGILDVPFDVETNTFKAGKVLALDAGTVTGDYEGTSGLSTMIDRSGVLHVAYWASGDKITHAAYSYNRSSDTLTQVSAPIRVDTGGLARHPSLAVSPLDNSVTVTWVSLATSPRRILGRVRDSSGQWSAVQNVSATNVDVWTSTSAGIDIDQGPSLVIESDGTKHLTYIENYDSTGDYGRIHYVTNATGTWNDVALASYTHDPALALDASGGLYIIGHGHPRDSSSVCKSEDDLCVRKQNSDGTWGAATMFAPHATGSSFDASPSVKWSVVGWNRPETIEFLFFRTPYTAPTLFYGRLP